MHIAVTPAISMPGTDGRGIFWQGRYGAVAMDEGHLAAAARYVALNPVRARLVDRPEQWPWSSARAHLAGKDDQLVEVSPLLERLGDFAAFLGSASGRRGPCASRKPRADRSGAPNGSASSKRVAVDRWRRESVARSRERAKWNRFRAFSKLSP